MHKDAIGYNVLIRKFIHLPVVKVKREAILSSLLKDYKAC